MTDRPRTLVEKIWDDHVVAHEPGAPSILAIDLHLVHEVTSPQAFTGLRARGAKVRRPDRTVATADHSIPTTDPSVPFTDELAIKQLAQIEANCREFGIPFYGKGSASRGIVHVIGPELGLTQPGMTIVCGDSHTATHGAFGALAFGIGTSEIEMVLATQTLLQRKPKTYQGRSDRHAPAGRRRQGHHPGLDRRIGVGGGTGHVFEYTGDAIRALSMEARMTLCNMSIEGGARAGLVAPDETTFAYLKGRPHAPKGSGLGRGRRRLAQAAQRRRRLLRARDRHRRQRPRADGHVRHEPRHGHPGDRPDPDAGGRRARSARADLERALAYMGLRGRQADRRPEARRRLHRLVHQRPDRGPARRRFGPARPARGQGLAGPGRPGQPAGQGSGRRARACTRSSRPPAPSGARAAARCASP